MAAAKEIVSADSQVSNPHDFPDEKLPFGNASHKIKRGEVF